MPFGWAFIYSKEFISIMVCSGSNERRQVCCGLHNFRVRLNPWYVMVESEYTLTF